jgi:succinate-semialdehyde dehydrogenase/glutarate-semialdehyde dehydrogenase
MQLVNPELLRTDSFIAGQWQSADSRFSVINPATEQVIAQVAEADVDAAISAAVAAQREFANSTASERAAFLLRWHQLVLANLTDLAQILTAEAGKPLQEAQAEIRYAASFIEWFAAEALRVTGDVLATSVKGQRLLNLKQPVGVVAAITPWNFPAAMVTRKLAPAFAAGCAVVLKPSELTPLTALALAYLADQAGIPKGVLNVITSSDAAAVGQALTRHPQIAKVTFTGSTAVGKLLMRQCADTVKRLSLELGGNAPAIVFADADLAVAVQAVMASKFRNAGQTCVCVNRILVEESIAAEFSALLQKAIRQLVTGPGVTPTVQIGPLINAAAVAKVSQLVNDAVAAGASLSYQAELALELGYFYPPTLLENVTSAMRISQQEIFGPVATIQLFSTAEEALQLANDSQSGLAAYLFTKDTQRIWHFSEQLQVGMLGINGSAISQAHIPFGGIKSSGFGREGSSYGIEEYLQLKHLCWAN